MTASTSAEASDDAARPLTDEEFGRAVRAVRRAIDDMTARMERLRLKQTDELLELHKEQLQNWADYRSLVGRL